MVAAAPDLVLASQSPARRLILEGAGLSFTADPADLDEDAVKNQQRTQGSDAAAVALALAGAKALAVTARHPGDLVIGADQMLECGGDWFDKPATRAEARATLFHLAGRTHRLISAVVLARDDDVRWHHLSEARLTMRPLDEAAIDDYLERAGDAALASVGAYRLEGPGAQLFEHIEGDYFTILGLPLLPLLAALRDQGEATRGLLP